MALTTTRRPVAHMWPPAARWREHVLMLVVRDTRGCELGEHERLNRFPANPYCCITWMLEGQARLVSQGDDARDQPLPRQFLHGCQTRPCVSRNEGERHSFCIAFYPDAFHALFGIDLATLQDAFLDAARVLPAHGLRLLAAVADARDDDARRRVVDAFLAAHAAPLHASPWMRLRRMGVNIGLHVAGGLLGVGPRQAQRLARREGGMSVPGLSRLWRSERSFRQARAALARGQGDRLGRQRGRGRLRRPVASGARLQGDQRPHAHADRRGRAPRRGRLVLPTLEMTSP